MRDEGALRSSLARARNRWHYGGEEVDLADLAAALGFGLVRNHAFVDGNKRISFQTMYVFLGLNGWRLDAPEPEVVKLMVDAASGEIPEADLAEWIRARMQRR